ncbi:MAG: FAD-binding protein [Lentisphaeria bacterium]|nr:FAD-binding protein [Lentisphaeria bacterium]
MSQSRIQVGGSAVTVHTTGTLIVGAGAAGMGCAVHLYDFLTQKGVVDAHKRILVIARARGGGASRLSGSDKQTYYKMGTSPRVPDTACDFARTLTAFGCAHGDLALTEGICSLRAFYHLVADGVPFPHDPEGAFIGYKTDHDPYERATSAGPKTSKFMSECLEARARAAGIGIMGGKDVVRLLVAGDGDRRRIVGVLTVQSGGDGRFEAFLADNIVLAAGGPGAMYATTVYPRGQTGIHGMAFEAGLAAHNLTESQYGLASIQYRWNVSGTYMQVVPRLFSTAADGESDPREFLTEYFDTMERMATCIFLKGYQWPFDAQRISGQQSSLVDMAVHRETVQRGRRVWMDFLRNPIGTKAMSDFAMGNLEAEARVYLQRTGALQALPIERLAHMNQPAIDLYMEQKIDLTREPLEIAICAQHQNGGFVVNTWWESTLAHTFVVGEFAGTHGVKRPGGSALNAGQTGAIRAAEYISSVYGGDTVPDPRALTAAVRPQIRETVERLRRARENPTPGAMTPDAAIEAIRQRMTRHGAHLRSVQGIGDARREAEALCERIRTEGLDASAGDLAAAAEAEGMALTSLACLRAIEDYIENGGGSRGSYIVLDSRGNPMPESLADPETGEVPCLRPENEALRETIQTLRLNREAEGWFDIEYVPVRPIPERDVPFETAWTAYREKKVFG